MPGSLLPESSRTRAHGRRKLVSQGIRHAAISSTSGIILILLREQLRCSGTARYRRGPHRSETSAIRENPNSLELLADFI